MKEKASKATKKAAATSKATARMTTKHAAQPRSVLRGHANNRARYTLSSNQLRRLLDHLEKDQSMRDLREVVTIISNTGMRTGELCQLRWADVDVHRRRFVVVNPKSPSIPEAEYVLGKSPQQLLRRLSHELRIVCDRVDLSGVAFHILRLTFFARLVNSGGGLESCMTICGWKSLSVAMKVILGTMTDSRLPLATKRGLRRSCNRRPGELRVHPMSENRRNARDEYYNSEELRDWVDSQVCDAWDRQMH